MLLGEAVTNRINELLVEEDMSLYRLSKISLIPLSTLKNLSNGHTKSPTLSMVYKIADAFGMSILDFLSSPVFNKENVDYL